MFSCQISVIVGMLSDFCGYNITNMHYFSNLTLFSALLLYVFFYMVSRCEQHNCRYQTNSSWFISKTGQWCWPLTCADTMHAFDTIMTWKRKPHKLLGVLHSRHWWFYWAGIDEEVLWVRKCIQLQVSCHLFAYTSMYCIADGCVCIDPRFSCCTSYQWFHTYSNPHRCQRNGETRTPQQYIYTNRQERSVISSQHIPLPISVCIYDNKWSTNVSNHNYTINFCSLLSA